MFGVSASVLAQASAWARWPASTESGITRSALSGFGSGGRMLSNATHDLVEFTLTHVGKRKF